MILDNSEESEAYQIFLEYFKPKYYNLRSGGNELGVINLKWSNGHMEVKS